MVDKRSSNPSFYGVSFFLMISDALFSLEGLTTNITNIFFIVLATLLVFYERSLPSFDGMIVIIGTAYIAY